MLLRETKRASCLKGQKHYFMFFLSQFIAMCGLLRPSMVLHGLFMVIYGLLWPFYGLLWQNIDSIGFVLSFLTVIDPNSFGLVSSMWDFWKGNQMLGNTFLLLSWNAVLTWIMWIMIHKCNKASEVPRWNWSIFQNVQLLEYLIFFTRLKNFFQLNLSNFGAL